MARPGTSWAVTHGVLFGVGRGKTYREIASNLGVSVATVVKLVDQYGLMCNRERKTSGSPWVSWRLSSVER
jgi:hypothetical protein